MDQHTGQKNAQGSDTPRVMARKRSEIANCGNIDLSGMPLRVASGAGKSAAAAILSRKSYSLQCLKDDAHYPGRTSSRLVDTNDPVATRCQGIMFATSIMVSQVISEPADKLAAALRSEECPKNLTPQKLLSTILVKLGLVKKTGVQLDRTFSTLRCA